MDIGIIAATIYFVGIAAITTPSPQSGIVKTVIFPEASQGDYWGTPLMPHQAQLNVRTTDVATGTFTGTPSDFCRLIGGTVDTTVTPSVCRVPLKGARLWMRTAQPLTEDDAFRRMPSFLQYNPNAMNLPAEYDDVDPRFVAARFDVTSGSLSACNRGNAQYITSLSTLSTAGEQVLYLEQASRTIRIVLKKDAVVAIENKPLHDQPMISQSGDVMTPASHFGWYYKMNGRFLGGPDPIARPSAVPGLSLCSSLIPSESALASADCSNSSYP